MHAHSHSLSASFGLLTVVWLLRGLVGLYFCLFTSCVTSAVTALCLFADTVCSDGFMALATDCLLTDYVRIWLFWVV